MSSFSSSASTTEPDRGTDPAGQATSATVEVVDLRTGERRDVLQSAYPEQLRDPTWSPDGSSYAVTVRRYDDDGEQTGSAIAIGGLDGSPLKVLTPFEQWANQADWHPQDDILVYGSGDEASNVFTIRADGSDVQAVTEFEPGGTRAEAPVWTPDGERIIFTTVDDPAEVDQGAPYLHDGIDQAGRDGAGTDAARRTQRLPLHDATDPRLISSRVSCSSTLTTESRSDSLYRRGQASAGRPGGVRRRTRWNSWWSSRSTFRVDACDCDSARAPSKRPGDDTEPPMSNQLPDPRLSQVYRLEATLAQPLDLGETAQGHRRIVPLTGGTFTGPELNGKLLPGASADWQIVLPDGTALGDIRYTLETDGGDLLYVQSRGVRHGSAEVLSRLGRGEDVDASEYTFRTSTRIESAAPHLDWLNKGVFISVAGRQATGVIYETYLVE